MVIVGAGLGGTATAVRLLQFAREPLEVERAVPGTRAGSGSPQLAIGRRAGLVPGWPEVTIRLDRESVVLGAAGPAPRSAKPSSATFDDIESICVVVTDSTDIQSTNALAPRVEQVDSFFVREEFVCFGANLSPIDSLRAGIGEAERYGAAIASELCSMVKELLPGQRLIMRLLDLRSGDAAQITTGVEVDHDTMCSTFRPAD